MNPEEVLTTMTTHNEMFGWQMLIALCLLFGFAAFLAWLDTKDKDSQEGGQSMAQDGEGEPW